MASVACGLPVEWTICLRGGPGLARQYGGRNLDRWSRRVPGVPAGLRARSDLETTAPNVSDARGGSLHRGGCSAPVHATVAGMISAHRLRNLRTTKCG